MLQGRMDAQGSLMCFGSQGQRVWFDLTDELQHFNARHDQQVSNHKVHHSLMRTGPFRVLMLYSACQHQNCVHIFFHNTWTTRSVCIIYMWKRWHWDTKGIQSMEEPPPNLKGLKDMLLMFWCQKPKDTFRGLVEFLAQQVRVVAEADLHITRQVLLMLWLICM